MSDLILTPEDGKKVADDLALINRAGAVLTKHYPGHIWRMKLDEDNGMLVIVCDTVQAPLLSNAMYGYRLFLSTVYGDPDLKCVMRAGGEILERAKLARGWLREGDSPGHVDGVLARHQPTGLFN